MNYLQRLFMRTPTRLWINNPTGEELQKAITAGAICGTTNPSYCSALLKREADFIQAIIDKVIRETDDNEVAADIVYQRATARFMRAFLPLHEKSGAAQGFVTMQDNPNRDEDPQEIITASERHGRVGKNYMAKIPATEAGLEAMTLLIKKNIPICATECFSISQAISLCELYEHTSRKCGKSPPFFVTHITGILDEELKEYSEREDISIDPKVLFQAGCLVARKQYQLIKKRGYRVTLLGGGARGTQHFTEFVGGDVHITLNWSTIEDLLKEDLPVVSRIQAEADKEIVDELSAKLPDFQRAFHEDALVPKEYKNFAPLQRFRNSFLRGWEHLLQAIEDRRSSCNGH